MDWLWEGRGREKSVTNIYVFGLRSWVDGSTFLGQEV